MRKIDSDSNKGKKCRICGKRFNMEGCECDDCTNRVMCYECEGVHYTHMIRYSMQEEERWKNRKAHSH